MSGPRGFARAYAHELSPDAQRALHDATISLADVTFEEFAGSEWGEPFVRRQGGAGHGAEWSFASTALGWSFPDPNLPRYTRGVARRLLVCLLTVGWQLAQSRRYWRSCVAEELALQALVESAAGILELVDRSADFSMFEEYAFEDLDFLLLFDPTMDGIEDSDAAREFNLVHLPFREWFLPFREAVPPHPYVFPGTAVAVSGTPVACVSADNSTAQSGFM